MLARILKSNPYHDERGRFTNRDKAGAASGGAAGKLGYNASVAAYGRTTDDPNVTVASVMANFSPEIQAEVNAVLEKAKSLPPTENMPELRTKDMSDWSDERKALHDEIINKILNEATIAAATPAEGVPPKFIVLGGRGGSGKSKFTDGTIKEFDAKKAIVLDSDHIKEQLIPPYEGWNAACVHNESAHIFDQITEIARAKGLNIVHDMTLKSMNAEREIQSFKKAGYDVEGHYMHLPRQESAKRGIQRYLGRDGKNGQPAKRGRLVPVDVMLGMTKNEENFDALKKHFTRWSAYDNQGSEPVLLTRSK